ncbi:MAG: Phosphatidylserine decarboxylase proenzyme [Desulfovibrio sp.]
MRQGSIGIAPEGYPFIFLCALSAIVFGVMGCWPLAFIFLAATWFSGHFFRDPERVVPTEADVAVSPADGKVVKIQPMPDPFTGEMRTCVCIFMNVCNVHVNRSPVAGKIAAIKYYPGKFFNAAWDKASTDNERCAYSLSTKQGDFTMVQIAGLIARRIVCRVQEGEKLDRGERFGLIRFGSRVDLYLPESFVPTVSIGDKVCAGQSVVAKRESE